MDVRTPMLIAASSALYFAAAALAAWRLIPAWDFAAKRQMGELATRFEALSMDARLLRAFLRIWGAALVGIPAALWLGLGMFPVACMAAVVLYFAPRHLLDHLIHRRETLLRDQMADAAHGLANAVKAGLTLPQGLAAVSDETPQPLAAEVHRVVFDYQRGRTLRESLDAVRRRLCLDEFTVFVLAVEVAMDRGGRVNESLKRISESLKEKQRLERHLQATTAAGRQVVIILSVVPFLFLGMFWMIDPKSVGLLFTTFIGQLVLVAAAALIYLGVLWAWKIVSIDF